MRARYRLFALLLLTAGLLAQSRRITPLGASGRRVALVIGNDAYAALPKLRNGVNDARAIKSELESSGFMVILIADGSREAMDGAIQQFASAIHKGDVALLYYAGHAVQIDGENYLAPVDLQATNEIQARSRSIKAGTVLEQVESRGAELQILILDACRDNPFGSGRSIGGSGLAAMNAGRGTLLAYATAPGRTAGDNTNGSNGLYTTYLLQALREPGLRLLDVFNRAGELVERDSGGKQIPWISSSVRGEFYFHEGPPAMDSARGQDDPDIDRYDRVRDSTDPNELETVAGQMKGSDLAQILQSRAKALRSRSVGRVATSSTGKSISLRTMTNDKDGLTYVLLPPGEFMQGCSPGDNECEAEEKPARKVAIPTALWMSRTPVTQEAYQRVIGTNPSQFTGKSNPVENLNWTQADAYCKAIGMRLPTAAEWEYAARAGEGGRRYGDLDQIAWYRDNSFGKTHPVHQKLPNSFGLTDMLGNVAEWVQDVYKTIKQYPSGVRIEMSLRGASWYEEDKAFRVSRTGWALVDFRDPNVGFRCAGDGPK